jgi:hypothetical protein
MLHGLYTCLDIVRRHDLMYGRFAFYQRCEAWPVELVFILT